jgi:hypothetical protein
MDVGQLGYHTATNLLMTSERHLPRREADEHKSPESQEVTYMSQESLFLLRLYVLYDIVQKYEIVAFFVTFRFFSFQKVLAYKISDPSAQLKKLPCLYDTSLTDVNTRYLTTDFGEGKQIAPFATSDFQDTC